MWVSNFRIQSCFVTPNGKSVIRQPKNKIVFPSTHFLRNKKNVNNDVIKECTMTKSFGITSHLICMKVNIHSTLNCKMDA